MVIERVDTQITIKMVDGTETRLIRTITVTGIMGPMLECTARAGLCRGLLPKITTVFIHGILSNKDMGDSTNTTVEGFQCHIILTTTMVT